MRATSAATRLAKSNSDPPAGLLTSMPSISTRVWLPSAPRMRTWVKLPTGPVRFTATPGTSRNTSETMRVPRSSNSRSVRTVTAAPVSGAGRGTREADTTISGPVAGVMDCAQVAGAAAVRIEAVRITGMARFMAFPSTGVGEVPRQRKLLPYGSDGKIIRFCGVNPPRRNPQRRHDCRVTANGFPSHWHTPARGR